MVKKGRVIYIFSHLGTSTVLFVCMIAAFVVTMESSDDNNDDDDEEG